MKPGFVTATAVGRGEDEPAKPPPKHPSNSSPRAPPKPAKRWADTLSLESSIGRRGSGRGQCCAGNYDLAIDPACSVCRKGGRIANCGRHFAVGGHPLFSLIKSGCAVCHRRLFEKLSCRESRHRRSKATVWTICVREQQRLCGTRGWSFWARVYSRPIKPAPVFPAVGRDLQLWWYAQRFPVWVRLDNPPPSPCTWD